MLWPRCFERMNNTLEHSLPLSEKTSSSQPLVVSQFMHFGLETCALDTSVRDAIRILSQKNIGSILIEDSGKIVGIWTRTDLLKLDVNNQPVFDGPISNVMSSPVCQIHQDELISSATYFFHKKRLHHLLVVDHDEQPVGVLSETDLVNAKSSESFLEGVSITELLAGELHFVPPEACVSDLQEVMRHHRVDALVVKGSDAEEYGIVSMRDLLRCFSSEECFNGITAKELASWPLKGVCETKSLAYVRNYMMKNGIHHLGVTNEAGDLIDLLNFSSLMHRIEENFYVDASQSIKDKEQRILEAEALYRDLLSISLNGILIYQNDHVTFANEEMHRMLAYEKEALFGVTISELLPEFCESAGRCCLPNDSVETNFFSEHDMLTESGKTIKVELTSKPITYHAQPACLIVANDLRDRLESERFQMLTRSVFDNAGEGILVTDADNRFVLVNNKFEEITGYSFDEVLGQDPAILASGQQSEAFYEDMWDTLLIKGTWQGEIWNRKKDGTIYPEWLTINAVRDKDDKVLHYVGVMNDLSQQKATEQQINRLSFYDILTGLPNVSLFKDRVSQAIKRLEEEANNVAVLIVDIARFKMINDALGYEHGDALLKLVAQRLNDVLQKEDASGRMGADNFLLMLEDVAHKEEVAHFAEEVIEAFEQPFVLDDHEHRLDVKIGIAVSSFDGDHVLDLMKAADEALYEAKKKPHSTFTFHSSELATNTTEHFFFEKALRQAIEDKSLVAYFQPQICLVTKQVIGAEALVRWIHPELGIVPPDKFIGISEATGLIIPLGKDMLYQACRQWLEWQKQGLDLETISVNVSAVQLMHKGFVDTVAEVIMETGIPSDALKLEVTESFLFQNEQEGIAALYGLKDLGVMLSMDDFGTGFSSLSYLKKLPLDQLKIDQSFVRSLPNEKEDMAIVDAVIAVSKAVEVSVIAEGVETEQQTTYLLAKGCDQGQGFGYSRPLPAEEFYDWWQAFTQDNPSASS